MLARANRKKLGKPLIEPQLGNDPDEVDVLDDLDRVLVGDGGEGGGCIAVWLSRLELLYPLSSLKTIKYDSMRKEKNTKTTAKELAPSALPANVPVRSVVR